MAGSKDASESAGIEYLRSIERQLAEINAKLDALGAAPIQWFTLDEASSVVGLSRDGLQYHVGAGNLRPVERNGRRYLSEHQLAVFLQRPLLRKAGGRSA